MQARSAGRPVAIAVALAFFLPAPSWSEAASPNELEVQPEAQTEPEPADMTSHTDGSQTNDYDEIVITATPHARRRFDVIQGTNTLSNEELERSIQSSIGETLAEQPGISSTYFGPGASRPVIRGLDGPRIRVLLNGIGTLDASVTSPDHAVLSDPLTAKRIEVVRGAGTLIYGSSAIGGVVNVIDGRIPEELPADVAEGEVRVLYGSAAEEKAGGAGITGALGPVAARASGFYRSSNDLSIPGFAVSDRLAAQDPGIDRGPYGTALSTDVDAAGGTLGASWIGSDAMVGGAYGISTSNYGVPSEPGEDVRIDLKQHRGDLRAQLDRDLGPFDEADFRFGHSSYRHQEIENGIVATTFLNDGYEGRLDLVQRPWHDLHGSTGFQFHVRDFEAIGDEVFTPPSETVSFGLYTVEEVHLRDITVEGGLRYEHQSIDSTLLATSIPYARSFDTVSFSFGAGWTFLDDYLIGGSISRSQRAPVVEELLSLGPHLATGGYEVGDPALDEETGLTFELTLRKRAGRLSGGVNIFYTRFDDFIFQTNGPRVDEDNNLDPSGALIRRKFVQQGADFWGGELQGAFEFIQHEAYTGAVDLALDYVQATSRDTGLPLPRITPLRIKGGIEGRSRFADVRLEAMWVNAQNRVAPGELPTDAYVLLNTILTLHPFPDRRNVTLVVQGRNLLDQEARVHSSFLKDELPLAGREARVSLQVMF